MKIRHFIIIFLLAIVVVSVFMVWKLSVWYQSGVLQQKIINSVTRQTGDGLNERSILTETLGMERPQNYLVLFLNNTELRPGGGFIGAYAVVQVVKGIPMILAVDGTEKLDASVPPDVLPVAPPVLLDYLKVRRWYFRDSNWSPDFVSSTKWGLNLYARERGILADRIDGVIGITPTAVEEFLKILGPITVDGKKYTSENFTAQLEYEVERGYVERGISRDDRKQTLGKMMRLIENKLRFDLLRHWSEYLSLFQKMLNEKQLVAFAKNSAAQVFLSAHGWSGEMSTTSGDYVLWADANLGAFKSDAVIERSLTYQLVPTSSTYIARVSMTYSHNGSFDWRTTRYRDYVRVFVPAGSKLLAAAGPIRDKYGAPKEMVEEGMELGRQWFGTFIMVEPGEKKTLTFQYQLAPEVVSRVKQGDYHLLIQKQIGTKAPQLTLDVDFGTKVVTASPSERPDQHGDTAYRLKTDLSVDREFSVSF